MSITIHRSCNARENVQSYLVLGCRQFLMQFRSYPLCRDHALLHAPCMLLQAGDISLVMGIACALLLTCPLSYGRIVMPQEVILLLKALNLAYQRGVLAVQCTQTTFPEQTNDTAVRFKIPNLDQSRNNVPNGNLVAQAFQLPQCRGEKTQIPLGRIHR
jgi:hypothetical protein